MNKYEKLLNDTMSEVKGVPITSILMKNHSPLAHSTLKLFNALPVKTLKKPKEYKNLKSLTELTVNNGFIFSPQVLASYEKKQLVELVGMISEEIGLSPEKMNASFHKSWAKVRDSPIEQLVFEQVVHYMTTYGYEAMGVYSKDTVYIPNEKLELPKLEGDIVLTVINGYTDEQLKEKLLKILSSGIALKSIDEVITVAKHCKIDSNDMTSIRNKEVKIALYEHLDIVPIEPVEFLRFIMYKTTGKPMIIINPKTLSAIKKSETDLKKIFAKYDSIPNAGYKRLAEIFLRFKPLFLAFKDHEKMSSVINKISHLSGKYHKPMPESLLNNITGMLKNDKKIDTKLLEAELRKSNIFRKIRLLQALKYRMVNTENIVYKLRNGKSHVDTMSFDNHDGAKKIALLVLKSIADNLSHLKGKKFYIPNNIKYALPATEKQFTGNIPSGSYVTVPKDMIFGVHWTNINDKNDTFDNGRIDLDLSLISLKKGKVGWDARYRTDGNSILFSGDITDAPKPKGASELFYISEAYEDTMVLYVNHFNRHYNNNKNVSIPFKIIIAEEHANRFGTNYTINPNNVKCVVKTEIGENQKVIGLIIVSKGECKFYFIETGFGNSISSRSGTNNDIMNKYMVTTVTNMITINDILKLVGATITDKKEHDTIDLSPESLQKDTFINMLVNVK